MLIMKVIPGGGGGGEGEGGGRTFYNRKIGNNSIAYSYIEILTHEWKCFLQ